MTGIWLSKDIRTNTMISLMVDFHKNSESDN